MVQRIAVIGTGFSQTGKAAPPAEIAAVAAAGFKPELIETRMSVFPGTPYERGLCALGYIEAGIRARDEGYAGIYINTVGDYGIGELRSAVEIPVVGAGEASMTLATTLGRKFGIVTIWPKSFAFIYDERLRSTGLADRCAGVFYVLSADELTFKNDDRDPVARMRAGRTDVLDRIGTAIDRALDAGADTIVLGCTCMGPVAKQIAARTTVPVVDAMTAGYKMTETLVGLGLAQSPAAFPRVAPDRLDLARKLVAGAAIDAAEPECDVCAVPNAAE